MGQENSKSYLFYKLLNQIGVNRFFRYLLSGKPKIVMYHGVVDDTNDINCWWLIKQARFVRQIKYVKENFNVISMDHLYASFASNKRLRRNSCVLTFDDGYRSYLTKVLPILKAEQIPSTVYVPTAVSLKEGIIWTDKLFYAFYKARERCLDLRNLQLGKLPTHLKGEKIKSAQGVINLLKRIPPHEKNDLTEEIIKRLGFQDQGLNLNENNPFAVLSVTEIQRLSFEPLVTIGSHSATHEILPNLPLTEAEKEIRMSKYMLEKWINRPVNHFSYPDGKFSLTIAELVREAGYKTATRIGLGLFKGNNLFQIPRLAIGGMDDDIIFRSMLNGSISLKSEAKQFLKRSKLGFSALERCCERWQE